MAKVVSVKWIYTFILACMGFPVWANTTLFDTSLIGAWQPELVNAFFAGVVMSLSLVAIARSQFATNRIIHALLGTGCLAILAGMGDVALYGLVAILLLHIWQSDKLGKGWHIVIAALSSVCATLLIISHFWWHWPQIYVIAATLPIFISELFLHAENNDLPPTVEPDPISNSDILGLPDRAGVREAFNEYRAREPGTAMLVMIRLEGFQQVNFHLGREFGDLLLAQSANRMKQYLQSHDVMPITLGNDVARLAHLGGLHFVFVCSLANQKHLHEHLCAEIIESTLKPFNVGNCIIEVSARASFVNCDEELGQFDDLLTCAFLALDSSPEKVIAPYEQKMQIDRLEQQARLAELAHIDFKNELELYFQPIVRNGDGDIEYVELLLRWQHPKQGILAASKFIDDIRIAGLALPLAQYVIERAAEIALALRVEGIQMPLGINLFGPEMLHEEFIEFVDRVLVEHQLLPQDIIIECPSQMFTTLDPQGIAMVARLRTMGVRLCVDGFGESPLLLAKLPKLEVDYVKLGRSLTTPNQNQGNFKAVVRGIVEMQNVQECKVICEGVESQEQLQFAQNLNAFAAQGYLFTRPLSSVGMISWLKQWRWEHPVDDTPSATDGTH
ncbi:GGDEF domain-containing phosphodiesterase [Pseudoalteromonas sp. SMS1]|uniref:GGDEF domain-containing phosphodiesterase n=1 Tax=Pseudoalteromonas sp. SMS1 TaxID=2908894 RepID=UPI001F2862D1|nr:GGDEF domain-containing phosphodiesterase [Pseudoalteromonas sp. SMS1]MCF2858857.1 GGDEF domain-containing phosphodiesterase [Pseudoalteromonas sp. SMS1]